MSIQTKAPSLFISHGSPNFAIEPKILGSHLRKLGQQLTGIRAILVVSPHWQTQNIRVMTSEFPKTIHDFAGFSSKLYEIQYPATGQQELAQETARLLNAAGFNTQLDANRGLDHGAWIPLLHLLPKANIPVFQVSMSLTLDTMQAAQLGRTLAPLRDQGVLIIGSGSMTHNLAEFRPGTTEISSYVQEFSAWVRKAVLTKNLESLIRYRSEAPHAQRAHPTEEHFLPLLVALGTLYNGDTLDYIDGGVDHGILSMDSFAIGMTQLEDAA